VDPNPSIKELLRSYDIIMGEPASQVSPRLARSAAGQGGVSASAGAALAGTTTAEREDALERVDETVREASRKVVLALLHALEGCFDRYGPAGFRVWIFSAPLVCLAILLDRLTGAPVWLSGLSLTVGAGGGLGFAAWSSWTR
jgi:hypothetical protein